MRIYVWGDENRFANSRKAAEAAGVEVCFHGMPEACDALLLPGGGDMEPWRYGQVNIASRELEPERDAAELALLERFLSAGKPVLGICRGLQIINVFFGGTLVQDLPGHCTADGVDRLHRVITEPSPLLAVCGRDCIVNSAHHQAADRLGTGLQAVQWAPDGTVEAVVHTRFPVWAVQWHPERLDSGAGARLFRAFTQLR